MPEFSRELYSFVEIARERSIRKAADKLNIASSALSRQMRLLESDVGVQLFSRRIKGVELTDQGRIFLKQAEAWLEQGNRLRADLSRASAGGEKVFRIGAMECLARSLVPELAHRVREECKTDRTEAKIGGTSALTDALRENALDLIVAFNVLHSQDVRVVSEVPSRIGMVYSPALCEITEDKVRISQCLDWPICLFDESFSLYTRLHAEILKQRKSAQILASSNSVGVIREMVARGECVSILSWFDVRADVLAGRVRFVPLQDKRLVERLCICVSGTRPFDRDLAFAARQARKIVDDLAVIGTARPETADNPGR